MAEILVTKVETQIKHRDHLLSPDAKGRKIVPPLKDLVLKDLSTELSGTSRIVGDTPTDKLKA